MLFTGHLETIGSLNYTNLLNVEWLHYEIPKISHSLILSLISSGKILHIRIQFFQNANFCLEVQILLLAKNTIGCFPWSARLALFISEKIFANCLSLNNHSLSVRCSFKWKCYYMKKVASSTGNSVAPVLSLRTAIVSSRNTLSIPFHPTNY